MALPDCYGAKDTISTTDALTTRRARERVDVTPTLIVESKSADWKRKKKNKRNKEKKKKKNLALPPPTRSLPLYFEDHCSCIQAGARVVKAKWMANEWSEERKRVTRVSKLVFLQPLRDLYCSKLEEMEKMNAFAVFPSWEFFPREGLSVRTIATSRNWCAEREK